ncbi:hypothetical protein [Klebsiella pneumoniae]
MRQLTSNINFMIGFALFAAPYFNPPVLALAWAVTVGGVLRLVYPSYRT